MIVSTDPVFEVKNKVMLGQLRGLAVNQGV